MLNVASPLELSFDELFSNTLTLLGVALYISKNENSDATSVTVDEEASTLKKPIAPMAWRLQYLLSCKDNLHLTEKHQ